MFGDNVRARMAARALPRTPTTKRQKRKKKKKEKQERQNKQQELHTHPTTAIPQPTTQYNKTRQDMHRRHNKMACRQYPPHTHTTLSTQHNHHRHSTMTQPCHNHTTLNQQRCNKEHKKGEGRREEKRRGEEKDTTIHNETTHTPQCAQHSSSTEQHTPPHFPTHNKHDNTRQKKNENDTRETDNVKRSGTMQGARPNPNTGITAHTTPRHSIGPQSKRQGGRQHTEGGRQHTTTPPSFNGTTKQTEGGHHTQDGEDSNTAALHSPCHPPSTMPSAHQ